MVQGYPYISHYLYVTASAGSLLTRYLSLHGDAVQASLGATTMPIAQNTAKKLTLKVVSQTATVESSIKVTLQKNGLDTPLTVEASTTGFFDCVADVAFADGDAVNLKLVVDATYATTSQTWYFIVCVTFLSP